LDRNSKNYCGSAAFLFFFIPTGRRPVVVEAT